MTGYVSRLGGMLFRATGAALDAVSPQTCVACEAWIRGWIPPSIPALCDDCRAATEEVSAGAYCPYCARSTSPMTIDEQGCGRCRREDHWNVAGIVRVGTWRAASEHDGPLARLLLDLKYHGRERNAELLGGLLAERLRTAVWFRELDALVPVPMHWLRRWQRPSDHARLLAEAVSRRTGVPVRCAAVRRVRYATSQARVASRQARFENVRGCFGPSRWPGIAGQTVCIIDNLLVTGATIHEVSKVLRKSGAKRIYAAVVARSAPPGDDQPSGIAAASTEATEVHRDG
jgi:ComF family protein